MKRKIAVGLMVFILTVNIFIFPVLADNAIELPVIRERETFNLAPCLILSEGRVRGQINLTVEDEDTYRFYLNEDRHLSLFFESQVQAQKGYFNVSIEGDGFAKDINFAYKGEADLYYLDANLKAGWYTLKVRLKEKNYAFVNENYYLTLSLGLEGKPEYAKKKDKVLDYGPITYSRYLQLYEGERDNPFYKMEIMPDKVPSGYDDNLYLRQQYYLNQINAFEAWQTTMGQKNITVAIIDRGLDVTHHELESNLIGAYSVTGHMTDDIHGTHVGGIVGAHHISGIFGMAPEVSLIYIRPFNKYILSSTDLPEAIRYAVDKGANVINLSMAFSLNRNEGKIKTALEEAMAYAYENDVVIVAAVGNDSREVIFYPSGMEHVIGVSSINQKDQLSDFSNYGEHVDLCAPGDNILSTDVNGHYISASGTSMATPIVSGVAALVLSINSSLTPDDVEQILIASAKDLGEKGWDALYGHGCVDAEAAVKYTILHYGFYQDSEEQKPMTRIDYIKNIMVDYNIAIVENVESSFADLDPKDYFNLYVHTAHAHGIIKGKSATVFGPYDYITEKEKQIIAERIGMVF